MKLRSKKIIEMIVTTTPSVEGKTIIEYKKIAFGEAVSGIDFIRDIGAGFKNFFGGRFGGLSKGYEYELINAREEAVQEMANRASAIGGNAVIGVDLTMKY